MEESSKVTFQRELDALATIRDELRVKAHLAKADVGDELKRLDAKWHAIEAELKRSAGHVKEPLDTIGRATKELVTELRLGYESVKRRLS